MTSPSLKRPLEFEIMSPHSSGASSYGSVVNAGKRRCFTQQTNRLDNNIGTGPGGGNSSSGVLKGASSILPTLSEDVASMIRNELQRANDNNCNNSNNDPLVLTIRQTQTICEKLIKDREQKLREEYDRILASKLAEQYDTFVRYTHDHIEKSISHQSSYLS